MTTKQRVAAMDFDGTITTKDTLLEFISFSRGRTAFYLGFLLFTPALAAMKLGLIPNWKVKQSLFSYFYKGTPLARFDGWGERFAARIDEIVRPKAVAAIREHKAAGDRLIIVSASVENWITPWARKAGVDAVLATGVEVDAHGMLTGRFTTANCYGKEKVSRLNAELGERENYRLVAYGDSRGDKQMIDAADEGFYNKFV